MLKMNEDLQRYIDLHPDIQNMNKRAERLQEIEAAIETAPDLEEKIYRLELYKDFSKIQYRKAMEFFAEEIKKTSDKWAEITDKANDNTQKYEVICQKLNDKLQEERKDHGEFCDNLCFALLANPRETFETVLQQVERLKKIECQDGAENWQWSLKFGLYARLGMAWRIVFGSNKRIPECGEIQK